jgi:zinc transport system substrate-binding protein
MKKVVIILLSLALIAGMLAACGKSNNETTTLPAAPSAEKHSVVTTIFPVYDWVRALLGSRAAEYDLTMLLDSGVDLHNYQPSAADIVKISNCDVFIYVGGESDAWTQDVLAQAENKDMIVINLLETLGDRVKAEEVKEGMEAEHEHEHDHEHQHEEGEEEMDEHVWLSVKNAALLCEFIAGKLGEMDEGNKAVYDANAAAYVQQLNALDREYQAAVDAAPVKTVLFGDRFPFRYMVDDYGLDYYAAFVGCSAESEASFETIVFLAKKIDELGLKAILQIETADGMIAGTIRDNTQTKDQTILTMNSLQSATAVDVENGLSYLEVMQSNLEVLKQALV